MNTRSNFTLLTGLTGLQEKKYVSFNKEKNELVIYGVFIEYDDVIGTTIMITGEENNEKKEMITIVKDVKYTKYETVLKVSNKELKAKGKTARDLLLNKFPNSWTLSNIDILNSTDKNISYYNGTRIPIYSENLVINKRNKSSGLFNITLASDKNVETIILKNNVITTMTQSTYLKQLKDAVVDKPQVVFISKPFCVAVITEMKSMKNDKYKLQLKTDIKELDKLKDKTTVDKLIHTFKPANAVLDGFCGLHGQNISFCINGGCRWCGGSNGCRSGRRECPPLPPPRQPPPNAPNISRPRAVGDNPSITL